MSRSALHAILALCLALCLASCALALPALAAPAPGAASVQWMVELDSPSAIEKMGTTQKTAQKTSLVREHLRRLDLEQAAFLAALAERREKSGDALEGARPVFQVRRVLNGVAVLSAADDPAAARRALESLPGVRRVRPMVPKAPTHATTLPFLGVPPVWDGTAPGLGTGLTGAGLRIGIIDTGVDYLHAGLGGSGLFGDYLANDPTVLDGFFPSAKVAGGWDFVGDDYDASSGDPMANVPQPDPDPMDCDGHGSHVAGTAAGVGVDPFGATYTGPYDSAVDLAPLRVAPGVAPEATLYALRVFGCSGTTNVVEQALEWAVDPDGDGDFSDRLDVVNLSLASRFGRGGGSGEDPAADAADAAALAGVVVVAAAGNDGDVTFAVGTPASADRAIAVASVWDDDPAFPTVGVRVASPPSIAGSYRTLGAAFGPGLATPIVADGVLTEPADACAPLLNGGAVAGRIAVIERSDDCTEPTRVRHAQDAGAVAALIVHHEPELLIGLLNDGTGGDITIPAMVIPRPSGLALVGALEAGTAGPLELDRVPLGDTLALNSSRGPRLGPGLAPKPDVAAPGVLVTSVQLGNGVIGGVGSRLLSGTSMASPHVAGLAALVLERRPDWSPAEVKAAILNTAGDVFLDPEDTPPRHGSSRVGAGRVRPPAAVTTELLAFGASVPGRVGLSFGHLEVVDVESREQVLRIQNRGVASVDVTLALDTVADLPGLDLSLGSSSVSVPAGGSVDVVLRLEARAADLRHARDPTQPETLFGFPRFWPSEETAYVLMEPADPDRPSLRLPILASARPASRTSAAPLELGASATGTALLNLSGQGVDTGPAPPFEERSLVSAFELHYSDPGAVGSDDLRAVGAASDGASAGTEGTVLYFGVATGGDISSPSAARYEVFLDLDVDGTDDFLLYASDEGTVNFGSFVNDGFLSVLRDLGTNVETVQLPLEVLGSDDFHTVPFHTNLRILAVRAADLGLAPGSGPIAYRVRVSELLSSGSVAGGGPHPDPDPNPGRAPHLTPSPASGRGGTGKSVDFPTLFFDPDDPGLDATGGLSAGGRVGSPIHFDLDGATIPVRFDVAALEARGVLGLLLFHHHGVRGERVEVVPLVGDFPDLRVGQLALDDPVEPGGTLVYRLTVVNEGSVTALGVELEDVLPPEVEAFLPELSDPDCAVVVDGVQCALGDLAPGAARVVELAVRIGAATPLGTLLVNRAEVRLGSGFEGDLLDNVSTLESRVGVGGGMVLEIPTSSTAGLWLLALGLALVAARKLRA